MNHYKAKIVSLESSWKWRGASCEIGHTTAEAKVHLNRCFQSPAKQGFLAALTLAVFLLGCSSVWPSCVGWLQTLYSDGHLPYTVYAACRRKAILYPNAFSPPAHTLLSLDLLSGWEGELFLIGPLLPYSCSLLVFYPSRGPTHVSEIKFYSNTKILQLGSLAWGFSNKCPQTTCIRIILECLLKTESMRSHPRPSEQNLL